MGERKVELVQAWLLKASHDLEGARLMIRQPNPILDLAAYHCQQAAEKSLKAYLTAKDCIFPKTHILEKLLDLCLPFQGSFAQLQSACERLTPMGDEFRYPGDVPEPTMEEASQALALAEEIYRFCERQLKELESSK